MIEYIKKIKSLFLKKIKSKKIFFNIQINTNKINNFLELKNIPDRSNFLWKGNWDNKKKLLENYRKYSPSYNSVFQIYRENINFRQCEEYIIKANLINEGKNSGRGKTIKELDDYFLSLDNLRKSLEKFGYKNQTELNNVSKKNDEIGVAIGKNWDVIKLQDKFGGTHRFALCKILNIKKITVSIKAMHISLFEKKELKMILNENNEDEIKYFCKKKLFKNLD